MENKGFLCCVGSGRDTGSDRVGFGSISPNWFNPHG